MKKTILTLILLSFFTLSNKAQVYDGAAGLRLATGSIGIGAEITYQYGLSETTRVDAGLGFNLDNTFDRFGVTLAAHKVFEIESGFSWFIGPGAQMWLYSYHNSSIINRGTFGASLGAQGGVEYDFNELDLPFTASVDARPMFNFVSQNSHYSFSIGLTARYIF